MAPELGLDLKLCAMKTVSGFAKEATAIDAGEGRVARLEELMGNLEEEQRKIDAFKRELPLCMHLISDVIEGLRMELEQCRSEKYATTCQEFIAIKSKLEEGEETRSEKDCKDKMNWMSSAQLWSDNYSDDDKNNKKITEEKGGGDRRPEKGSMSLESKSRCSGGAFVPFKGLAPVVANLKKEERTPAASNLTLLSPNSRPVPTITEDYRSTCAKLVGRAPLCSTVASPHLSLQPQQQSPRKARRCWSPELHRRFVIALQQLGGAQVATPKQIRELMKVDGLTNDEVKSHLQKYRLHTRRMPSSSPPVNRPVVMVGNLWGVPQDHYSTSQQSTSQSGSPQSPLQLAGSSRAISVTAGDSCEDEDGKSESYSWK